MRPTTATEATLVVTTRPAATATEVEDEEDEDEGDTGDEDVSHEAK